MEYANEISYSYDITPQVYTTLDDGTVQQVNPSPVIDEMGDGGDDGLECDDVLLLGSL